jgi:hypothetical protein
VDCLRVGVDRPKLLPEPPAVHRENRPSVMDPRTVRLVMDRPAL